MKKLKAMLKHRIYSAVQKFRTDTKGAVALTFALSTLPVFAAAGVAMDYNRVLDARVALQDLADRAALSAAAKTGTTTAQQSEGYAIIGAESRTFEGVTYTPFVVAANKKVTVTIKGNLEGTIMSLASLTKEGRGPMSINIKAVAKYVEEAGKPVCMLTNNPTADNAMYFRGTGDINATGCGFHSDSSSANQALHLQGAARANADFFTTVGGWKQTGSAGAYSSPPVSGQSIVGDPFNLTTNCPNQAGTAASVTGNAASPTSLSSSVIGNITIGNNKVGAFTPGIHYVTGTIDLKNGALLKGNGVTIVLCGPNAKINMNGGNMQLQAPNMGATAGFAVVGSPTATSGNTLQGGPTTHIRGIWYTHKSKLTVSGNAAFNVNSAYFPIIADQVEIGGTGSVNIGMDYSAYGFGKPEELMINKGRTVTLVE